LIQVRLVFETIDLPSDPATSLTGLVVGFFCLSPSTRLYVFERSRGRKVAGFGVVDFSHLAQFQPLSEHG
jgi:hypothetical protein